jgi:hypothetical protein
VSRRAGAIINFFTVVDLMYAALGDERRPAHGQGHWPRCIQEINNSDEGAYR